MLTQTQRRFKKARHSMDYTIQTLPHEVAAPLIERYRKLETPIDVVYGSDTVTVMVHNGLVPIQHTNGSFKHRRLRN